MGTFFQVPVDYFTVALCGVANMLIGFLWYGPLFGKEWMRLVGLTQQMVEKRKDDMPKKYMAMFGASLITAYALFHFIWYAAPGAYTLFIAMKTAAWGWIGFVFPIALTHHLFTPEKKPMKLLFIETGYHLVGLVVMASIFFFFK